MDYVSFQKFIMQKGVELYRPMPWRENVTPYSVLVSEMMLQQTQVDRVIPKFLAFMRRFPDIALLSSAPLSDVLTVWQGLGYNRRAKYLHRAAHMVVHDYGGQFPRQQADLVALPGVGINTAGAVSVYAFNQPSIFVETNVRTVYIHHFFADDIAVSDEQIREVMSKTIDQKEPRKFYWSLMDYGTYLKRSGVKNINRSKHYVKQSPLKGSVREARGKIITVLTEGSLDVYEFRTQLAEDDRFEVALEGLIKDGLVVLSDEKIFLAET